MTIFCERIAFDEFLETGRRRLDRLRIVDHGEVAVIIGYEDIVGEITGNLDGRNIQPMRHEESGRLGFGDQVRVETKDDIRLGALPFELQTGQKLDAIGDTDIIDLAGAELFEGFGDLGTRAPFADETFIGIDSEDFFLRACRNGSHESGENRSHRE